MSIRAYFTSSLPIPSFGIARGLTNLMLDGNGCINLMGVLPGRGTSTTQFSFDMYRINDSLNEPDEVVTLTVNEDPDNRLPSGITISPTANTPPSPPETMTPRW
ncbi:MAG: hypothetical protein OXH57_02980 [Ekhidna sp.]|nr:hypothetical protein [Ekhidna sp.]